MISSRLWTRAKLLSRAMVDLSKCFDMMLHDKLLEKLSVYGIDSFWFIDYLYEHTQQVQVTNMLSVQHRGLRLEKTVSEFIRGDR